MTQKCAVIDYDCGNLLSVCRAIEHCGGDAVVITSSAEILEADRLILPGVGAFGMAMARLKEIGLTEAIRTFAQKERPFLGICIGMQIMFDYGEEFGHTEGLGLIGGGVKAIPATTPDGTRQKLPHIGWSNIHPPANHSDWGHSILRSTPAGEAVYFLHSFVATPDDNAHVIAESFYNGVPITAAVQKNSMIGCQFHPEKSGVAGLNIIRNFLES